MFEGVGNFRNYDSGHATFDIKLVATKFHGSGDNGLIVIHLVANSLVPDNANLMCQLVSNAFKHYIDTLDAPTPEQSPAAAPRFPPEVFLQVVDGVSTNWGLVTFAFVCYLVKIGVVASFQMARNPVGTYLH